MKLTNREIDALVAESVFNLNIVTGVWPLMHRVDEDCNCCYRKKAVSYYSIDIAAAWEAASRVGLFETYMMHNIADNDWRVFHGWSEYSVDNYFAKADTAPMAICLAVLKLNGVEI